VNPTPSWGGSDVGDYQVLPSNDKNDKQIASRGVPVGLPFDDDDFNINLAITAIDHACMANANAVNNVHNNSMDAKPTCSPLNGKKGGASVDTLISNAVADSANTFSSFPIETSNAHIVNSIAGSGNHNDTTGANSLPPSGHTSGG